MTVRPGKQPTFTLQSSQHNQPVPKCTQMQIFLYLTLKVQYKQVARELASPSHITETRKSRHITVCYLSSFSVTGQEQAARFSTKHPCFGFNWFISFPIKLHWIWCISFLNKVVNTNRKHHVVAQMQI